MSIAYPCHLSQIDVTALSTFWRSEVFELGYVSVMKHQCGMVGVGLLLSYRPNIASPAINLYADFHMARQYLKLITELVHEMS